MLSHSVKCGQAEELSGWTLWSVSTL
jgi:hypothetical protein